MKYTLENLKTLLKLEFEGQALKTSYMEIADCSWDTAKNKLEEGTEIKLSEAITFAEYFDVSLDLLFNTDPDVFLAQYVRNNDTKAS